MWQNKYLRKIFAVISSHLELQSEIFSTYIYLFYAHKMYFKVIRITVTSPSDFSVLENFHREMHSRISRAEQDVNQLSGFHFQKWLNMPANFILKFQATVEKTAIKSYGDFFRRTCRTVPLTPSLYLVSETHTSPEFLDSMFLHPAVRHPHTEKTRST